MKGEGILKKKKIQKRSCDENIVLKCYYVITAVLVIIAVMYFNKIDPVLSNKMVGFSQSRSRLIMYIVPIVLFTSFIYIVVIQLIRRVKNSKKHKK